MSQTAIQVSGLGKRYVIEHESRHDNLRDTLHHGARKIWRRLRWGTGFEREEFWALRDVSFEVPEGEVVGIVGRNGAGKSTLLKILSRITEPTNGTIRLRGRVASLLEVGTGFHPDLTGRENVFLNGAILGMSRAEIRAKFDEIVAFAEIERFLDTPVKRYSSGMYVRLAFAVAAHLDPEILIVDEVLAVGDAQFQKKCLGKMQEVSRSAGRTVLFVSHNIGAVRQLTTSCLYLERGRTVAFGPTPQVVDRYVRTDDSGGTLGRGQFCSIVDAALVDEEGNRLASLPASPVVWLELTVDCDGLPGRSIECTMTDLEGVRLGLYSPGHMSGWRLPARRGAVRLRLPVTVPALASGTYAFDVATTVHGSGFDHYVPSAVVFATSALQRQPANWELRKEYNAGYIVLGVGDPVEIAV